MTYRADPEGYRTFVIFGSSMSLQDIAKGHGGLDEAIHEVAFKTQEELDAYCMGVSDMDGWMEYEQCASLEEARDHVIEEIGETPDGYAKCRCQNCGKLWREKDLKNPIPDLHERVDPGEPMPNGECPGCGAVAHEEETDEPCEEPSAREGEANAPGR